MKSRQTIRQKYEDNKRNCLMKKIRFYEYLIGYGNTDKSFVPGVEIKNKTTNFFFPALIPLNTDQYPKQKVTFSNQVSTIDPSIIVTQMSYSQAKQAKTTRSARRETYRLTKRENIDNIEELITKSMKPSIRINKKHIQTISNENKTKTCRIRPQWSLQERRREKINLLSANKRTYIGDVCYIKQSKKQVQNQTSFRKQSICPWEIENELPY